MQRKKRNIVMKAILTAFFSCLMLSGMKATKPLWTLKPKTPTDISVAKGDNAQMRINGSKHSTGDTSGFPIGTSIINNGCVGTLNVGATCDITITSGGTASPDINANACTTSPGTEPVPTKVTVSADND